MLKKIIYGLLILSGIGLLIFFTYVYMIFDAFGGNDKPYSTSELKENYLKNQTKISELISYYEGIVPKDKIVDIEFENNNTISRLEIYSNDPTKRKPDFLGWGLKFNSEKTDSIIKTLNWKIETLEVIKNKLDKSDCIQIKNGEPTQVGFKRSGMGMYYFNIFHNPFSPADFVESENFNKCHYRFINQKLVLEYGGGAIGPQCFPENDE